MKKKGFCCFLALMLILAALPLHAAAITFYGLTLTPYPGGCSFSFFSDQEYVRLAFSTSMESGKMLLHSETGEFSGVIPLPCTVQPERMNLELTNLNDYLLDRVYVTTEYNPQETHYAVHSAPPAEIARRCRNMTITSYIGGVQVDFDFPGYDQLNLTYHTAQQTGTLPFYADADYHYCCRIDLPITYAANKVGVEVFIPGKADSVGEAYGQCGFALEEKVKETAAEGRLKGVSVCLDPGHCNAPGIIFEEKGPNLDGTFETSPSLCGKGHYTLRRESIVVLEIAYLLRDELRRQGAEVVMTREDEDTFIGSIARAEIANDAGVDFMIRLHADDREDDKNIRGIQVFGPSTSSYAQACYTPQEYRDMAQALMETIRDGCGYSEGARGNIVMLNDNYVGNNWAKMPCFLIEMGFLSNRQDDYMLSDPDYQQLMAESIADGIYEMALIRGLIAW